MFTWLSVDGEGFTPRGRSSSVMESSSTDALMMPLSGDSFSASSAGICVNNM